MQETPMKRPSVLRNGPGKAKKQKVHFDESESAAAAEKDDEEADAIKEEEEEELPVMKKPSAKKGGTKKTEVPKVANEQPDAGLEPVEETPAPAGKGKAKGKAKPKAKSKSKSKGPRNHGPKAEVMKATVKAKEKAKPKGSAKSAARARLHEGGWLAGSSLKVIIVQKVLFQAQWSGGFRMCTTTRTPMFVAWRSTAKKLSRLGIEQFFTVGFNPKPGGRQVLQGVQSQGDFGLDLSCKTMKSFFCFSLSFRKSRASTCWMATRWMRSGESWCATEFFLFWLFSIIFSSEDALKQKLEFIESGEGSMFGISWLISSLETNLTSCRLLGLLWWGAWDAVWCARGCRGSFGACSPRNRERTWWQGRRRGGRRNHRSASPCRHCWSWRCELGFCFFANSHFAHAFVHRP